MDVNKRPEPVIHVVFGAGGAGGALFRELAAQGKAVRAVTRSGRADVPAGVEAVAADAADPASAQAACAGAGVVYHAVNVPCPAWPDLLPPMMDSLIAAAGAANATLVYVDTFARPLSRQVEIDPLRHLAESQLRGHPLRSCVLRAGAPDWRAPTRLDRRAHQ